MSKLLASIVLAFGLVGCADQQAIVDHLDNKPLPSAKDSVPLNLPELPPLDLGAYKTLKYIVVKTSADTYSCTTLDDVQTLDSLFFVLQDRLAQDKLIIVKYKDYYEGNQSPKQ